MHEHLQRPEALVARTALPDTAATRPSRGWPPGRDPMPRPGHIAGAVAPMAAGTNDAPPAAAWSRRQVLHYQASTLEALAFVGGFAGGWAAGLQAKDPFPKQVAITVLLLKLLASWLHLRADAENAGPWRGHVEPAVPRPRPAD